jgi:hypothetical protein
VFVIEDIARGVRLTEVATGKILQLEADGTTGLESRTDTVTGHGYLVIHREERPPLALATAGFAFALDPRSTGPLPAGAPSVLSFTDYRRLVAHLRHLVPDAARRREALELMMILIAALDGARAVGLPIAAEELELEPLLRQLES